MVCFPVSGLGASYQFTTWGPGRAVGTNVESIASIARAGLGMHGRVYVIRTGCAARACVRGAFELHARTVIRGKRRKTREVGNPYA